VKNLMLGGLLALVVVMPEAVHAQTPASTSLGSVTLSRKVMADGQPLAAGTYQVRLSAEPVKPVVGQSPEGAKFVEFLQAGKVVGREIATVISNADMGTVMKGEKPNTGGVRVEMLKGNDYVRVWINRGGQNYILHLPPA
jgi:hypothetical protein